MNIVSKAVAVAIAGGMSFFGGAAPLRAQDKAPANPEVVVVPSGTPSPSAAGSSAGSSPSAAGSSAGSSAPAVVTPEAGGVVAPASAPGASAPVSSQPVTMAAAPPTAKPLLPDWMNGVTLGAGVLLWYYQPLWQPSSVQNNVSVFWARLLVDGKWGIFSLHLEPRFRDTPLRSQSTTVNGANVLTYVQDNQAWLQEAYAQVDFDEIQAHLKLGKEYSHLGFFWDNSFYGNIQVYDGLKLDPDYGASLEGDIGKSEHSLSLGWWAQYFFVDGQTNVSLPTRDTISVPGGRRRNQVIGRLEPRVNLGGAIVTVGISGEYLQAVLPPLGTQNVWRGALDASITVGGLKILGEVQHQDGRNVTSFPLPFDTATGTPGSSADVDHAQVGGEYTLGPVTARYYVSMGSYNDVPLPGGGTVTHKEWLHVPSLGVAVNPHIYLLGELVFWEHDTPTTSTLVDRSFNLTLNAHL